MIIFSEVNTMKNIHYKKIKTNKIRSFILLLLLGLYPVSLFSQGYEGSPCKKDNRSLIETIKSGQIRGIHIGGGDPGQHTHMSSSFLKAEGKPPAIPKADEYGDGSESWAYDSWTCMYDATKAWDGKTNTAWSEGVKGPGIGEILLVYINISKKAEIWTGFGKSESLFKKNNRPKKVRLHLFKSTEGGPTQNGYSYGNLKKVSTSEVTLKDVNKYQPLNLPKYTADKKEENANYILAIEILEVYKGSKYDDTLITEIKQ